MKAQQYVGPFLPPVATGQYCPLTSIVYALNCTGPSAHSQPHRNGRIGTHLWKEFSVTIKFWYKEFKLKKKLDVRNFSSSLNFGGNQHCFHPYFNALIVTKFCTYDDSTTIMGCAEIWTHLFAGSQNFHQILSPKPFERWILCTQDQLHGNGSHVNSSSCTKVIPWHPVGHPTTCGCSTHCSWNKIANILQTTFGMAWF